MIPACADRTAALITSNKREIRRLTLRRASVELGGLYLAKQAKSGAAEPHEICSSSCTKCECNSATKARKKTDFVQEINNASLINHTLITRCPPSQPLCNLWTSLLDFYVRRACAVIFCTCSERISSYSDIFSSTQGAVRPKRLLCRRQRLRSSMIARREARYFIDTNLKCAI